ncbi:MAG: WecB/TagA/CpsF family glycosyltransferase, partial [Verrucomicrobiales bacterium]|nr:WecB/TagA/CpsF family glycosyltransferase [Verrucomicrobiales bacterium]
MNSVPQRKAAPTRKSPIAILGVPFDNVTMDETVEIIAEMIASREPHYLATANVDFVVQAAGDVELRRILFDAHLVLCDGMPLVWASRKLGNPLPGRVTGSDLVPRLLKEAERRQWRVFFLGGTAESVRKAADNTQLRHPGLQLVGAYSPPFKPLLEMDHDDILRRVTQARPDLLFVAFGCPKQEKWINMHYRSLGVPVSVGVGATIDFLAGTFRRAPRWMQRTGTEWLFRMVQEPRRLLRRYSHDSVIFSRAILNQVRELRTRPGRPADLPQSPPKLEPVRTPVRGPRIVSAPARLDAAGAGAILSEWSAALESGSVVVDCTGNTFVDSTGVGLLVRLRKRARELSREFRIVAAPPGMVRAMQLMKLDSFFDFSPDVETAVRQIAELSEGAPPARVTRTSQGGGERFRWEGDVTAATVPDLAEPAESRLAAMPPGAEVVIDLSGVPFADSSGVGFMVRLKKRAWQRGVKVAYATPTAAVSNV